MPLKSFIRHPHFKAGKSDKPLLFNVETDIASANNVADENPQIVERLLAIAEEARRDLGDQGVAGAGQRAAGKISSAPQPVR